MNNHSEMDSAVSPCSQAVTVICSPQSGFTLLEVMIAVAVLAIALTTLLGSQSQSISLANEAKFFTTASLLGKGKMAELELAESDELKDDSGDFGEDFPGYGWEVEVNDFSLGDFGDLDDFSDHLKQVDLTVFWGTEGRRQFRFFLRHYFFEHGEEDD
jgi:general secretion pathway protein I